MAPKAAATAPRSIEMAAAACGRSLLDNSEKQRHRRGPRQRGSDEEQKEDFEEEDEEAPIIGSHHDEDKQTAPYNETRSLVRRRWEALRRQRRNIPARLVLLFVALGFVLGTAAVFIFGQCGGNIPQEQGSPSASCRQKDGGDVRVFPTHQGPTCGVYYYYHVSKNGGTSVMHWQKQMAERNAQEGNAIEYVELMDTFGKHGPMFWDGEFRRITELINSRQLANNPPGRKRKKWVSIHHHHRVPGLHYAMPLLRQWRRDLAEQGCALVLTTTLREPESRTESLVFFNHLPKDRFDQFVKNEKESQVYYLLYNTCQPMPKVGEKPRYCDHPGVWLNTQNRTQNEMNELLDYLSEFDLLGRTDELGRFLEWSELRTGWKLNRSEDDGAPNGGELHSLPSERPYEVDEQMKQLVAAHTRADQQLWAAVFEDD